MNWDVFNGDADGLCALHQLRLAEPADAVLVTGTKRDIALVARVRAEMDDRVTVLDISLDRNREALTRLLERGVRVRWFDHHYAGEIPLHPLLEPHIDSSPEICTSMLADQYLGGRFRVWAVVAAYGDGLEAAASELAAALGLDADQQAMLHELGEDLNYNAYGESEADLAVPPAALYRTLARYADPFRFGAEADIVRALRANRRADMEFALAVTRYRAVARGHVYILPNAPWSRRVSGTFANHLAAARPDRAHAVLVPDAHGGYRVSIRAPSSAPNGASDLARAFATGGGREAAAGIDHLPAGEVEAFIGAFDRAF